MGRPREFDTTQALEAAMNAFWQKGYASTSMADLMEAMDLRKGSIYKAFGDKHALFVKTLEHYMQQGITLLRARFAEAGTPLDAVRLFLELAVEQCRLGSPCMGCYAANTVVELGPHDEKVNALLSQHLSRVRQLLVDQIVAGQANGSIREDLPPADLAEFLSTLQMGIVSRAKNAQVHAAQDAVVAQAMAHLQSP